MKLNIRSKLILLGVSSVIVTVICLAGIGIWQSKVAQTNSTQQVNDFLQSNIAQITTDTYTLIQSQDEAITLQVSSALNVFKDLIDKAGGFSIEDQKINWPAINQLTKESKGAMIPHLLLGEEWLGRISNANIEVPVLDEMLTLMNSKATVYQPMPDGSGILRVATNIINKDGNRAIGTYIPKYELNGAMNKVFETVMAGSDYLGVSYEVDAWYITAYHPVTDQKGDVIAVISVGVKQESVATLRQAIVQTKVGSTGTVTILGGKGDQQGQYIISHDAALDGQSAWNEQDADENYYVQKIIAKAVQLAPGETSSSSYLAKKDHSKRIVQSAYYAPWDWVIVVTANEADYQNFYNDLKKTQLNMMWLFVVVGLGLAGISYVMVSFSAARISKPIIALTNTAQKLAEGNIYQDITHQSTDETGDLADAFRNLILYIQNMAVAAGSISDGDLSLHNYKSGQNDVLGTAFEKMLRNLRQTISVLKDGVTVLDNESRQLGEGSSQVNQAASQISVTIQEVAHGANDQAASITKTTTIINDLNGSISRVDRVAMEQTEVVNKVTEKTSQITQAIQEVEEHTHSVQQQAQEATDSASQGVETVEATLAGMKVIQTKVNHSVEKVNEMGKRSNEIGQIVETIDEIASQTNLLALNAAIEAARAGEHGKGFAVVADEVRKLSERSTASTKEISDLIKRIQETVIEAIAAMEDSSKEVISGVSRAEKSGESLKKILVSAEMVNTQAGQAAEVARRIGLSAGELDQAMHEMSGVVESNRMEAEEMASNSIMATEAIDNIASISEESSAAIEEVSASTEEVTSQIAEFAQSVDQLVEMTRQLRQAADNFKLE